MKTVIITEAQFVSLFGGAETEKTPFYQDGAFSVSHERMNKARDIFYPRYREEYGEDKAKMIHKLAFAKTMKMVDQGENLPEFGDVKIYHSIFNKMFSRKQVEYVENMIRPELEKLSVEELYDKFLINMERSNYETRQQGKNAVLELLNNGTFDKNYPNLKDLALWTVGKLDDINEMLSWLFSYNQFTKKRNIDFLENMLKEMADTIADNDDTFMANPTFNACHELLHSISVLKRKQ